MPQAQEAVVFCVPRPRGDTNEQRKAGDVREEHRPQLVQGLSLEVNYSSSPRRRRGAGFFLHGGQGEMAPVVSAAGAVAPDGTIQS